MVLACIFCINNIKSWCWRSARLCFFSSISSCFRFKSSSCSLLACRYSIASAHFDLFFFCVFHHLHCLQNPIDFVLNFLPGFPLLFVSYQPQLPCSNEFFFMLFIFVLTFLLIVLLFIDDFLKKHVNLGHLYIDATGFILLFLFSDKFLFQEIEFIFDSSLGDAEGWILYII